MASGPGHDQILQGEIAERELLRLAQEARLIALKADPDRAGWDYCVEESEAASELPLDLRPPGRRWMVQVKSVGEGVTRAAINLLNWQRMAKQPLPWLVLVVQVKDLRPIRAFLIHVGDHWIKAVLERLTRMASGTDDSPEAPLHEKTMSVTWAAADELSPADGATFASRLQLLAGAPPAEYAAWKQNLVATLGYEGPQIAGTFRIPTASFEQLAEFAVGLRDEIPIATVSVDRIRFGLSIRECADGLGKLMHSRPPVHGRAHLTVVREGVGSRCSLPFEIASASAAFPFLPSEQDRVVFRHPLLTLVLGSAETSLRFTLELGDVTCAVPIESIGPACEFLSVLADASQELTIEVQPDGAPTQAFRMHKTSDTPVSAVGIASPVADAWIISRRVGLDREGVVPDLLFRQRERLRLMRVALEGWSGASATIDVEPARVLRPGNSAVTGFLSVLFGGQVCSAGVSCVGVGSIEPVEPDSARVVIRPGVLRLHGLRTHARSLFDAQKAMIRTDIQEAMQRELEAMGVTNIFQPDAEDPDVA